MQIVGKGVSKKFFPGEIWKDNNGVHINAHGGGVINYKGTYYWFGEHKCDTTSSAMVGVTCYSSKNLVELDFPYPYSHQIPFPFHIESSKTDPTLIQQSFDSVFNRAAGFL